jgi:hypothetical protein
MLTTGRKLLTELQRDGLQIGPSGAVTSGLGDQQQQVMQSVDEGAASASFVIVTRPRGNPVNRNGNAVRIQKTDDGEGLQLHHYQNNPLVLWDHGFGNYPFPIGKAEQNGKLAVTLQATKATSTVFFDQGSEFAMDVFRLVAAGTIKMASIGFRPLKAIRLVSQDPREEGSAVIHMERQHRYWDIVESELQEWSVVNIGADRGALRQCLDRGSVGGESLGWTTQEIMRQHAEAKPAIGIGLPDHLRQSIVDCSATFATLLVDGIVERLEQQAADDVAGTADDDPLEGITQASGDEPEASVESVQTVTVAQIDQQLAERVAAETIANHLEQRLSDIESRLTSVATRLGHRA